MKKWTNTLLSTSLALSVFSTSAYAATDVASPHLTDVTQGEIKASTSDQPVVSATPSDSTTSVEETAPDPEVVTETPTETETDSSVPAVAPKEETPKVEAPKVETPSQKPATTTPVKESVVKQDTPAVTPTVPVKEEVVPDEVKEEPKKEEAEKDVITEKSNIYVKLFYSEMDGVTGYVPTFTFILQDKDGKTLSTMKAGSQNYNSKEGAYNLVFNRAQIKSGEQYRILLSNTDGIVGSVVMYEHSFNEEESSHYLKETTLKKNQFFPFSIKEREYESANGSMKTGLTASKLFPLEGGVFTDTTKTGIIVKNPSGNPIKNASLRLLKSGDGSAITVKTNNQGIAWVGTKKLSQDFYLEADGKTFKGANSSNRLKMSLPTELISSPQETVLTYTVEMKDAPKQASQIAKDVVNTGIKQGVLNVDVSTSASTELSKNWTQVDLTLTDSKGKKLNYSIDLNSKTLGNIPQGTYKVSATGKYANVKLGTNTLKVGAKTSLSLTLSPKYTLDIGKDGKYFKYSFLNVESLNGKVYSGADSKMFAVTPGESYMVKDQESGKITTVAIDSKSFKTKVVLGVGVVFGGSVTTPHTGDVIIFLIVMFAICLILAGVFYFFINRNNKVNRNKVITFLVMFSLVSPLFAPFGQKASADSGGGSGGSTGGGSQSSAGVVQTHKSLSVLMAGFIDVSQGVPEGHPYKMNSYSTKETVNSTWYMDDEIYKRMMFVAPNDPARNKLLKSNSALVSFDWKTGRQVTLMGKNPLVANGGMVGSNKSIASRTLPSVDALYQQHLKGEKLNGFDKFMMSSMKYMMFASKTGGTPIDRTNKQLYVKPDGGSTSNRNIGDALSASFMRKMQTEAPDTFEYFAEENVMYSKDVFYGYTDRLKALGGSYVAEAAQMRQKFDTSPSGSYVLYYQVAQAFYIKGREANGYAWMPMSEAAQWYYYYRKMARPSFSSNPFESGKTIGVTEQAIITNVPNDNGTNRFENVAPTSTYVYNTRKTHQKAIKPKSTELPIPANTVSSSGLRANPYQGWGYLGWGAGEGGILADEPELDVKLKVKVVDKNGVAKSSFTTDLRGWQNKPLSMFTGANSVITGGMTILNPNDGKLYTLTPQDKTSFTLVDQNDTKDNLNRNTLRVGAKDYRASSFNTSSMATDRQWEFEVGWHTPFTGNLASYLGSPEPTPGVDNKYEGQSPNHSDALLTLNFVTQEQVGGPPPKPVSSSLTVKEWELSRYFPTISPNGYYTEATMTLKLPVKTGWSPSLSPSGNITFNLVDPDVSRVPWFVSNAKLYNGESSVKYVGLNNLQVRMPNLAGDLLAIRKNEEVDNIKLASWVNNFSLFDGKIKTAGQGAGKTTSDGKQMKHTFKYGIDSPTQYYYTELDQSCSTDAEGNTSCYTFTIGGYATETYTTAEYNTTVDFERLPTPSGVAAKSIPTETEVKNGHYWEAKQSASSLNVNPEVLMSYDDVNGNANVTFSAADVTREIKPVHYNLAQYVRVDVKPQTTGMSTATDQKAKELAGRLNAGGKSVIYKDSAVTNSHEVKGELELRTFALDIGATALKNSWNPGTTYSTDAVNREFLDRHADQKNDGTWEVTLDTEAKLKIGGREYGGKKSQLKAVQKSQSLVEHTLVIRGGKLHSVNGETTFANLHKELQDALIRMKVSTKSNIFDGFVRGDGENLSDKDVVRLGNAVRGTSDLKVNQGWYNEDSTVLVIREYINVFTLPSHQYSDKMPLQIPSIETPVDKLQFFTKGLRQHSLLRFKVQEAGMEYDSSEATPFGGAYEIESVVPNASVMDSFQ